MDDDNYFPFEGSERVRLAVELAREKRQLTAAVIEAARLLRDDATGQLGRVHALWDALDALDAFSETLPTHEGALKG